jgi:parallel beta-helix repeat protein
MKQRSLQFALVITTAITLAVSAGNVAAKTAALPACSVSTPGPSLIGACGCAITKAGNWVVTQALIGTPSQDCIDISAAKVNLRTNGVAITGVSGSLVGINILKSASNANVQLADPNTPANATAVGGFATGIEVQGSGAIVSGGPVGPPGFDVSNNSSDGLLIKGASNCSVINFTSNNSATGNGVTISGGSGCQINLFTASGNAGFGLQLSSAKSQTIEDFDADDDFGTGVGNTLGGIALTSSSSNTLSNFSADNNLATDIVLSNSSKNSLFQFSADGSVGSGIALSGSSSNSIYDFDASDNAVYGLWLQSSSSNSVRFASALGNTEAGIYLGCSPTMPGANDCPAKAKPSSKNIVTAIQAGNDDVITQLFGVAVDLGDLQNNLSGITATGDTTDLDDLNASCGTNVWFANAGTITIPPSPSCTAP